MLNEMYTRSFSVQEMACKCNQCEGYPIAKMNLGFMLKLQKVRDLIAAPLIITSGYRCMKHNLASGGSPRSYHLRGMAADISLAEGHIRGSQATFRMELVEYALKAGLYGIGIGSNFIHLDSRGYGKRRMWVYS